MSVQRSCSLVVCVCGCVAMMLAGCGEEEAVPKAGAVPAAKRESARARWTASQKALVQKEMRAAWINPYFDLNDDPDIIDRHFGELAREGLTDVVPIIAGQTWAYYPTDLASKATRGGKVPEDVDLAELYAKAARKHGLRVHFWVCPWDVSTRTKFPEERLMHDETGSTGMGGKAWDLWACPSIKENRDQALAIILEIVRKYDPDGINLDYIRYPGQVVNFSEVGRRNFEAATGLTTNWPNDVRPGGKYREKMLRWRQQLITSFVEQVHREVHKLKPGIILSADVFRGWATTMDSIGQAPLEWVDKGIIDLLMPMNYTHDPETLLKWGTYQIEHLAGRTPILCGIMLAPRAKREGLSLLEVEDQIYVARKLGFDGICFFQLGKWMSGSVRAEFDWEKDLAAYLDGWKPGDTLPWRFEWELLQDARYEPISMGDSVHTTIALKLRNPTASPIRQKLVWDFGEASRWNIEPASSEVTLDPGKTAQVKFKLAYEGRGFEYIPVPVLKIAASLRGDTLLETTRRLSFKTDFLASYHPVIKARKAATPPALDGRLNDPCWQGTPGISTLLLPGAEGYFKYKTEVCVVYDGAKLYIMARCADPDLSRLVAKIKGSDKNTWPDDSIEFFIDPKRSRVHYYQFAMNSIGTFADGENRSPGWNSNGEVKAGKEEGAWTVEFAVSWKSLGLEKPPVPGTRMGFNVARSFPRISGYYGQWSPTFGSNHTPERFGDLVIE